MKKLFYSFIVAMVCVAATGCGSKSSNSADGTEVASSGDIDGFLDAYEDAMDTYVVLPKEQIQEMRRPWQTWRKLRLK